MFDLASDKNLLISRRDKSQKVVGSLRGSLAERFAGLQNQGLNELASKLLLNCLHDNDPELVRYSEGEIIVVGKKSEMGTCFPDW